MAIICVANWLILLHYDLDLSAQRAPDKKTCGHPF
jgi:hypothetical protein